MGTFVRMSEAIKNQQAILQKFGISQLNTMQEEAIEAIQSGTEVVLLSPTGTGKTLAYLLPIIEALDTNCHEVQILILVPSRELAIQIEQVTRKMGAGFKVNAVYGGRAGSQDRIDLKHRPAILVGTPGRVADRLRRDSFPLEHIKILVLDEFDKSLEIGFEKEMSEIMEALPAIQRKILTSATHEVKIPQFIGMKSPVYINYLKDGVPQLSIKTIITDEKDKLEALALTLNHIGNQPGIIFCSFKDALQRVSNFLHENNINHGCFHGGMEQIDRERALIKFRNGTHQLLVATDLAARGLDIPELKFILHYHLPMNIKEFTHRNGRTARMNSNGLAYLLQWKEEELPDFIQDHKPEIIPISELERQNLPSLTHWTTIHVNGGRRDKISKGDIAGLFLKQGQLNKEQLGTIELGQDCAYIAVQQTIAERLIQQLNNSKLKKKKVRVSLI